MSDYGMKIVIIGTINKDLILPFGGSSIQSFGGIFYSLSALTHFVDDHVTIYPISFIGSDVYSNLLMLFKKFKNVDSSGLIHLEQKNHEVILEYLSPEDRTEKALFNFPSIGWENIKNLNQADFFIINMITGWDLSLEAYRKLSQKNFSKMYLDVHFLVMGTDQFGKRYPRRPDNILEWLQGSHFIQMNQREFGIINTEGLPESVFFEKYLRPDQYLIITLAGEGANVIFRKNNMIRNKHFPAIPVEKIEDVTGCGDVFGVSFVWNYLQSNDVYKSIEFANLAAGAKCFLRGTNEMDKLVPKMKNVKDLIFKS
jgi:pfkB family carbohydrate kinase